MVAKLNAIAAPKDAAGYEWTFQGPLAEFVKQWDEKFVAFPQRNADDETGGECSWVVGVTQHNSFGAR
jgi:hypothetical protein